ncbi:MAG: hypothetical protein ABJL67_08640 [Sulfitobacter sp.]
MEIGAIPELSDKWWVKNKAKTVKKSGLGAALKAFEVNVERAIFFKKLLDELKASNPKYADVFDRVLPTLVNLGLAGARAGVSYGDSIAKVLDHVNTSLGLFNDIASEGQAQLEASIG